jgi:hypothetical protein
MDATNTARDWHCGTRVDGACAAWRKHGDVPAIAVLYIEQLRYCMVSLYSADTIRLASALLGSSIYVGRQSESEIRLQSKEVVMTAIVSETIHAVTPLRQVH